MGLRLDTDVQFIKGVGPRMAALFSRHGIYTVKDFLEFYPRTYEDRKAAKNISMLEADELVSLKATILNVRSFNMGASKRKIYEVIVGDSSGRIACKFFRVPYKGYFERFQISTPVRVIGRVTDYRGRKEFHHPDIRDIDEGEEQALQDELLPLYVEIEGMSSNKTQKLIQQCIGSMEAEPRERIPEWLLKKYNLMSYWQAIQDIHQPPVEKLSEFLNFKAKAQQRIIFEEFFWLELYLVAQKIGFKKDFTIPMSARGELPAKLKASLPFKLTAAQERVTAEINGDLEGEHPMHRLVQGDVGSGKTMVAWLAALKVVESGYQVGLMVPTEILAEQHFNNAKKLLEPLGLNVALLSGRTKSSERRAILEQLVSGQIHILIGTHALIEEEVRFKNLSLVIVDEQHRFGVQQRGILKSKGQNPHFLIMTATPIPRTLAMTVYGDLDVSVIDELPPGRTPIQTRVVFENKKPQVLSFLMDQIEKGRQAYIVYPLVEESEKIDLKSAVEEFEKLKVLLPKARCGLLHGKMKSDEKDEIMNRFRAHEVDILVSTTVIEVGVDVPNSNLMIIEHAERFGLSQLHQLRGRVGRGAHKSYCILIMGHAVSEEARDRTRVMEQTTDGFKIAEADLELRGPGEFLGTRQSGLPGFKMANLVRDVLILQEARQAAFEVFNKDKSLRDPDNRVLREELLRSHGPTALAGIG
jgi:ATP-dependent DNA helicase RecG